MISGLSLSVDAISKNPESILERLALLGAQVLYLFAPLLAAAALAGVVLRRDGLRKMNRPIDGGLCWRRQRVFGDGKTWRGVFLSMLGGGLVAPVQQALQEHVPRALQVVDYSALQPVLFGITMGLGAILGELPNSFVKRQLGIPRGGTASGPLAMLFYIWDQVDTLIGAWPFLCLWFKPPLPLVMMSFVISLGLHPLVAWIGYRVGARQSAR